MEKILKADPSLGFHMDGFWVWCGSVLKWKDGYHMFASRWSKKNPMFEGYIFTSEIVHAFSPDPLGPYTCRETVLPTGNPSDWNGRMAHNPTVLRYGDRILLYYIASTYDEAEPFASPNREQLQGEVYRRIRIGLAIADSPEGPWTHLPGPVLEPVPGAWDSMVVTNPAPCVLPDGRIYLYYRSNTPKGLRIGLAAADKPEGPYRRLSPEPVQEGFNVEDPFAWHDGKEFHIWAKDMEGTITGELHAGAHFVSADGIRWTYREKAYSRSIRNRNGEMIHLGCLERPQLLFDENGEPEYLFAAAADGPGGFRNAFNTWNIAVALNE